MPTQPVHLSLVPPVKSGADSTSGNQTQQDNRISAKVIYGDSNIARKVNYDRIKTDDLYPDRGTLSPTLNNAFQLLDVVDKCFEEATDHLNGDRPFHSDDAIQRVLAVLPELFCCRSISDGFGAIINAVYHGIVNMRGEPLEFVRIKAAKSAIRRLRTEPYLIFQDAVDQVISLENAGFIVTPEGFDELSEALSE
jgi:hypothetical protein